MSLSFPRLSEGEAEAPAPDGPGIASAFGAAGEFASSDQVDEALQLLLLLFGPAGRQDSWISVQYDVAGIGEAQLPRIASGALRRKVHDRPHQIVGQHRDQQF